MRFLWHVDAWPLMKISRSKVKVKWSNMQKNPIYRQFMAPPRWKKNENFLFFFNSPTINSFMKQQWKLFASSSSTTYACILHWSSFSLRLFAAEVLNSAWNSSHFHASFPIHLLHYQIIWKNTQPLCHIQKSFL